MLYCCSTSVWYINESDIIGTDRTTHCKPHAHAHTRTHTHTLTDDSVGQELVDGGESNPSCLSTGVFLSNHLQEGREEGGGVRDSIRWQHHQLV